MKQKTLMYSILLMAKIRIIHTFYAFHLWLWTTKPVTWVKLRFIHHMKAKWISFPLMYGFLG